MRKAPDSARPACSGVACALITTAASKARRATIDNLMAGFACLLCDIYWYPDLSPRVLPKVPDLLCLKRKKAVSDVRHMGGRFPFRNQGRYGRNGHLQKPYGGGVLAPGGGRRGGGAGAGNVFL